MTDETAVQAAVDATLLAFGGLDIVINNAGLSLSKSLMDTTVADWDLQHNVMAKGSFLVSRAAAKALIEQKLGGDIVYISSKNSLFAGPNNIAYSATKADQAHQVRLLAAELGEHGVKVNGINPDGVVRGSGIFAGGWGAKRAAVYGVPEEELGKYYASRTLLKREVLPENVANAVFVLCSADLSHTTGLHIPVDAGVAAAFLRGARRAQPAWCPEPVEGRAVTSGWVAAVDLGATSGRVMLGHLGPDQLSVEALHRFSNDPVRITDGLHWNILELYRNLLIGLREAVAAQPDLAGIGIDSWAVDYGLVSGDGLINNPFHYRDERTARGVALVHKIADHASLYATNGLQFQPFNSIYQLAVDHEAGVIDDKTRMLMLPDLLAFWLTGEQVAERTNASTTGLLDIGSGSWNTTLIDKLSLPRSLFPLLVDPGTRIGALSDDVRQEIGGSQAVGCDRRRVT